MNPDQKARSIILGILGSLFIAAFFWLFGDTKLVKILNLSMPRNEILAKAEQAFNESDLAKYNLSKRIRLVVHDELNQYAQVYLKKNNSNVTLAIGYWQITWSGKVKTKESEKEEVRYVIRFDFNGNLIGLEEVSPFLKKLPNLPESEAIAKATIFLSSFNIDSSSVELTKKRIYKEDKTLNYDFTFTRPSSISSDLIDNFTIFISGPEVTEFQIKTSIDENTFKFPKAEKVGEIITTASAIIVWVIICLFLIVIFFKRLRHDELEFKRAIWLGIAAFIIMWTNIAIQSWPKWEEFIIGGGIAGVFTGGSIVIAYSLTESLNREVWRKKLALTDLLFQGYFQVKEVGAAILNSFFVSGLALLIFGVLIWLTSNQNLGYLDLTEDSLRIFGSRYDIITNICENLIKVFFIGFVILSFWSTYLRSKIKNVAVLIIVLALFYNFSGLHFYSLRPSYLSFFLAIPFAIFVAYVVYKFDLLTILLTLFAFNYFADLSLISLQPDGFFGNLGVITGIFTALTFVTGVYFIYSKDSVKHFENYVPQYVSRIAERERFLQELEIARSVQKRFLPQTIPAFPNLDIASICRPAMEVGGDYYDFICDGRQRLSVVIGDVSGKGVSAAFYMTMAKGIIKTLSKATKTPGKLLTEMNAIFYENAPREVFISVIYGLFDMKDKMLTFARAGHNPLIVRKSMIGEPESLKPKGLAIGLEKGLIFSTTIEEMSLPIEPGDVFVFYTDGISESMNKNGEEFGENRLRQLIGQNAHLSAQELMTTITAEVNKFAQNATQHDDFTMIVVKVGS